MPTGSGKMNTQITKAKRFGTTKQLVEAYHGFTTGGVRNWLFYDTDSFRSLCSIKIGAKILIDFDAVDEWLEDHREAA